MCAGLRVTAKARDLGEVEAELVLEPVDGIAGAASEDLDEVVACELARLYTHHFRHRAATNASENARISSCPRRRSL
jgi:hypothetical protein